MGNDLQIYLLTEKILEEKTRHFRSLRMIDEQVGLAQEIMADQLNDDLVGTIDACENQLKYTIRTFSEKSGVLEEEIKVLHNQIQVRRKIEMGLGD